jgi:hypothetical protein
MSFLDDLRLKNTFLNQYNDFALDVFDGVGPECNIFYGLRISREVWHSFAKN